MGANSKIEMKYKKRKDGEVFSVPSGVVHRIACCDCGLVHDFVFLSHDGKPIGIVAVWNKKETKRLRRK